MVYRNTKLATIEAKAWDKPYTEGVSQAKSNATKLVVRFAYSTNDQKILGSLATCPTCLRQVGAPLQSRSRGVWGC
jgi:hypothetical protein